jgi:hypothetical protein
VEALEGGGYKSSLKANFETGFSLDRISRVVKPGGFEAMRKLYSTFTAALPRARRRNRRRRRRREVWTQRKLDAPSSGSVERVVTVGWGCHSRVSDLVTYWLSSIGV